VESDATCRESQLHALCELDATGYLSGAVLVALRELDESTLRGSEIEYMELLRRYLHDPSADPCQTREGRG
jgi:hypothetical protein